MIELNSQCLQNCVSWINNASKRRMRYYNTFPVHDAYQTNIKDKFNIIKDQNTILFSVSSFFFLSILFCVLLLFPPYDPCSETAAATVLVTSPLSVLVTSPVSQLEMEL